MAIDHGDWLSVRVDNDGLAPDDAVPIATRGFGLVGMRERVESQGGTVDYGPDPSGCRWSVRARLRNRGVQTSEKEVSR